MYTSTLFKIIQRHLPEAHCYADDTPSVLHVGDFMIDPSVDVRNLGTIFDNPISMDTHINQVCKTAFYHIHNIRRISKYLSQKSLKTLVHAFVTSRLDYCNSLLYGLPKYHISKLQ